MLEEWNNGQKQILSTIELNKNPTFQLSIIPK